MEMSSLSVCVQEKPLLHSITLSLKPGTVHVLMGPNGSGKSSLAMALIGHPDYQITHGTVELDGVNILELSVDKRAKAGLFLVFQHPVVLPGVTVLQFLHEAYRAVCDPQSTAGDFYASLIEAMDLLEIEYEFAQRSLHDGFSGGQKKKIELLQLLLLKPKVAILDELDSGLDVDALHVICKALSVVRKQCPYMTLLIITHYQPLLDQITPDYVHVLKEGTIIESGDATLAQRIGKLGFDVVQ